MLVLGCPLDEEVLIEATADIPKGTLMRIVPLSVNHGKKPGVRIGFDMPRAMHIIREAALHNEGREPVDVPL